MRDIYWEEVAIELRLQVFNAYRLRSDFPKGLTFEQADACWMKSRWITIKYTFVPTGYWDNH